MFDMHDNIVFHIFMYWYKFSDSVYGEVMTPCKFIGDHQVFYPHGRRWR